MSALHQQHRHVCSRKHTQHLWIKPKWLQTHWGYLNLYYFSRVNLLSELVSFHSHLHRCWRIWIIHAICVIYVFAYSWRHECVCAMSLLGRQMKTSTEFMAAEEKVFFSFFFYCNSVIKLDSVRVVIPQRDHDQCVEYGGWADRGRLVLPFVFLPNWLNVTLISSLHPKNKNDWKARRASGQGFPQPPSLISFTASSSDSSQKQRESNLEKMREWRSHRKKRRGESGDKGEVRKPAADSSSSDNSYITELISSCTVSADVVIWER